MVNLKVESIKRIASDSVTGDELKQEIEPEPEKHPSHVRMEGKDIRGDMEVFIVTSVVTSPDPESSGYLPEELSEPESSSVVPEMSESDSSRFFPVEVSEPSSIVPVELPARVNMESVTASVEGPGMSSLQEMFDNIQSSHSKQFDEVIEEISLEQIGDGSILQEVTTNNTSTEARPLFRDYNIDDIIHGKVVNEVAEEEDDLNSASEDEESDEDSEDEELPIDYRSLADLNARYMNQLNKVLMTLQIELQRNQERQQQIDQEIYDVQAEQAYLGSQNKKQHRIITRKALSVFASPYFKDKNIYFPPPNQDTITKKHSFELDVWVDYPKKFSKEEKLKLKEFVREDAIRIKGSRLQQEMERLKHQYVRLSGEDPEKEEIAEKLQMYADKLKDIETLPEEELFANRFENYDWDKISATDFRGTRSPAVCRLQWQNSVHPAINNASFSPNEDKLLKKLAEALNSQDWDSIAKEMETGRTAIACFVRYMTRHNIVVNNRKWEKTEDDRLRRLVAHCRLNKYIPWQKVAYFMERRTKDQCYQRFVFSLRDNIRRGPFSDAEDMLLVMGEKLYGNDWTKINEILSCRTPIQLHCRFNHFIKGEHRAWTEEEDVALLEQIRTHGLRDWVLISQMLSAQVGERTRNQCRQRFQFIYKAFKKNPGLALANIEYKDDAGVAKKRYDELYSKLREKFLEWKEADDEANPPHPRAQSEDIQVELAPGLTTSRKVMVRFIGVVQQSLPPPEPPQPLPALEERAVRTLPGHEEELFKRPVCRRIASKNNMGGKKRKINGYDHRKFKPYRAKRGSRNRERLGQSNFKTQTERNIAKFFRSTWIIKNKMSYSVRFSEKDLGMLVTGGLGLGKILNMNKIPWQDLCIVSPSEKQSQLLGEFRGRHLDGRSVSQPKVSAAPRAVRTYARTYSRKAVKQSDSRAATPVEPVRQTNTINMVPPSQATLVGFRGVLLRNEYLANPHNTVGSFKGEKDTVDDTLRRGTDNPQLCGSPSQPGAVGERSEAHRAADQLLVKRFLQLFYWPAKMSTVAPPKQENVFSDDEEEIEETEGGPVIN